MSPIINNNIKHEGYNNIKTGLVPVQQFIILETEQLSEPAGPSSMPYKRLAGRASFLRLIYLSDSRGVLENSSCPLAVYNK